MKITKSLFLLFFSGLFSATAFAQNATSGATQNSVLALQDVVGVDLSGGGIGGGGNDGGAVDMPIGGVNALANGIESAEIKINLQSTAPFDVAISSSSTAFTYTGAATTNTEMLVKDVLTVMVTENNTGGNINNGYTAYQPIDGTNRKSMINSGQPGERSFAFKYKANPGFKYPAGTYTTDIVYTITKR